MSALRTLMRDGWVIGIACAAALAYAATGVLETALGIVFEIVDGVPAEIYEESEGEPFAPRSFLTYEVVINGHIVMLEPFLRALALLATVFVVSAYALHATRSPEDESAER